MILIGVVLHITRLNNFALQFNLNSLLVKNSFMLRVLYYIIDEVLNEFNIGKSKI